MIAEQTTFTILESPFGDLVIAGARGKIRSMRIVTDDGCFTPDPSWIRADDDYAEARAQLAAYFAGELKKFSLPLDLVGTSFQIDAWRKLLNVPYGTTTTYGDIARSMGGANASRAVGGAMNRNPITIIVPCHRVVGRDGTLTGYLNGTEMKRRLLALEAGN